MFEVTQRRVLLAWAGVASLTALYLTYRRLQALDEPPQPKSLHRSNANRRPPRERRWRRGFTAAVNDFDYTTHALGMLVSRVSSGQGYGLYKNAFFRQHPEDTPDLDPEADLRLLPTNLEPLYRELTLGHPEWTDLQRESLRDHIHMTFVDAFLLSEYPEGYKIGPDLERIKSTLASLGVKIETVAPVVAMWDIGQDPVSDNWFPTSDSPLRVLTRALSTDGATQDLITPTMNIHPDGNEMSENSFGQDNEEDASDSQNTLDLLYHIAAELARKNGYIHRGVECNSCGKCPIEGIRYHCANCFDYDLCETCEAGQVHVRNHVFYKIRIPAPSRGHIKQVAPKWYPGNPNAFPPTLPGPLLKTLLDDTGMDRSVIDALYEQFKCLAGCAFPADPSHLGTAIDRRGFDLYFIPASSDKPSPANLIYDRIFSFYDTNNDGLIGFEEYIKGISNLQDKSRTARLTRIFRGYDLDGDGYVERRDFLRVFRAYYTLSKELNREMVNTQEDFGYTDEEIREVVAGSQPISAAFGGNVLVGHNSRGGEDKRAVANGDLAISNGPNGVLQNDLDLRGDRERAIGNAAVAYILPFQPMQPFRVESSSDEPLIQVARFTNDEPSTLGQAEDFTEEYLAGPDPPLQVYGWPDELPSESDIKDALGVDIPLEEITDPVDRSRVLYAQSQRLLERSDAVIDRERKKAVAERWHRRQFYLDEEEGMSKPQGYVEPNSSEDEDEDEDDHGEIRSPNPATTTTSRRPSPRSRSSSKVRFDDSAIDTDYETRSNASSRSIPANERWGGFELGNPEIDVGKDVLYEAIQQGFNQILDIFFQKKEDELMEVVETQQQRSRWREALRKYEASLATAEEKKNEGLKEADMQRIKEMLSPKSGSDLQNQEVPAGDLPSGENENTASTDPSPAPTSDTEPADEISELGYDSTFPQFRPSESDLDSKGETTPEFQARLPPSRATLAKWLEHERMQRDPARRGLGALSFAEFKQIWVVEAATATGEEEDEQFWEKSADLGRFSFVGTWLEMANF